MVLGHSPGGNTLLPFGTVGAALFFFCSGMNTIISLERSRGHRGLVAFNLFFILLLFFGGYFQIVIVHPQLNKIIAEFFQLIALGMLLILVLFKIIKSTRVIGYLFFLPFLIHLGFTYGLLNLENINPAWGQFFFRRARFYPFPLGGVPPLRNFYFEHPEKDRSVNGCTGSYRTGYSVFRHLFKHTCFQVQNVIVIHAAVVFCTDFFIFHIQQDFFPLAAGFSPLCPV